jgi:cytosine/adenosine deaminase-related metal-dependent hydrolase
MKTVFTNALILVGEELEVTRGYLVVENGIITEIGEGKAPSKDYIDVKGGIVVPSFTNTHVHLGDSIAQDLGAYEPIKKRVGKDGIKFKVLKEDIIPGIKSSIKEMLSSGTTCFCDFREGGIEGIRKLKQCLRGDMEAVILGRPDGEDVTEVLKNCDGIGISSIKDYHEEDLRNISKAVRRAEKILAIHAGEVEDDIEGALSLKPSFLVHLTNASEESLELVFDSKVPVVLCPRANAMLGVGIPKLEEIFENALVSLGTDNVMVNSLNMLREMEFVFKAIRGLSRNHCFDGKTILKAATINGRKILGLKSNAVQEGNEADFLILRNRKYLYDPILAIIHRLEVGDIRALVKGSRCIRKF